MLRLHLVAKTECLCRCGAQADAADDDQQTAMHKACHHGRRQTVYILLGYCRWPLPENSDGKTGLQLAVEQSEDEVAWPSTAFP